MAHRLETSPNGVDHLITTSPNGRDRCETCGYYPHEWTKDSD